jgi:hypothetical protein
MTLSRLTYLKGIFFLGALFVLIGVSTGHHPQVVSAHPLGNFTINHYSRIELAAEQVILRYALDMAEIPTFQERVLIDRDQDSQLSEEERIEYLNNKSQGLKDGLELLVNGNLVIPDSRIAFLRWLPCTSLSHQYLPAARLGKPPESSS